MEELWREPYLEIEFDFGINSLPVTYENITDYKLPINNDFSIADEKT